MFPKAENIEKPQAGIKLTTVTDVINNIKKLRTTIAVEVKKTPRWKCKSLEQKKVNKTLIIHAINI